MNIILYKLELIQYVIKYPDGTYSSLPFPMYVPLQDDNNTEKDTIRKIEYIQKWIENYAKEKNFEIISSSGGSFDIPNMFSHQVSYKDLYDFRYNNYKCSKYKTIEYLKYKKYFKKYTDTFIYLIENQPLFIINTNNGSVSPTSDTEIDIAICNHLNIAFNLNQINKGLWWAIKKDIKRKFM